MTPSSRRATRRSWATGHATSRRPSMSSARARAARLKRAVGGSLLRRRRTPLQLIERLTGALRVERKRALSCGARPQGRNRGRAIRKVCARGRRDLRGRSALKLASAEARALASCVAALHYSRRSAALAGELAKVSGEAERFLELRHFCLSGDVAEPIKAVGAARIAVAETPDEAALFHLLSRDLSGFPSLGASRI